MMYGLRKIEKFLPQDINETKSMILIPIYRFVTSANFLFGLIVIAILFILIFLPEPIVDDPNNIGKYEIVIPNESMVTVAHEVHLFNKYE